jgi:cytochrome c biogenesis protein CcmG, thiol:disulfide interchange protein DsbE
MLYRILVISILLAATVIYSVYQKRSLEGQLQNPTSSGAVLRSLPDVAFENLEGDSVLLHQFIQEKQAELVVVHFWGTWCAPCEAELPHLLSFIKRHAERTEIKFLLVAVNDDLQKVRKHIKSMPVPENVQITWLMDNQHVYRDQFGTTRVPETYVFAADKSTLRKFVGPQEWNKPMFFQLFDEFRQISSRKL